MSDRNYKYSKSYKALFRNVPEERNSSLLENAIEADIKFVVKTEVRPIQYAESNVDTASYEYHRVAVHDARQLVESLTFDTNGFELAHVESSVEGFDDSEAIRTAYYPEIEALLRARTGASRVHIIDHRIRASRPIEGAHPGAYRPLWAAHNDYTPEVVPKRLIERLGHETACEWLSERVLQINVWRSLNGIVEEVPLALCDARSVMPDDLVAAEFRHPNRISENYLLRHNAAQRWYYFPDMSPDEVVLIKGYDSQTNIARFTPHAAIDVRLRENPRPRLSVEVRAFLCAPKLDGALGAMQ